MGRERSGGDPKKINNAFAVNVLYVLVVCRVATVKPSTVIHI